MISHGTTKCSVGNLFYYDYPDISLPDNVSYLMFFSVILP